MHVPIPVKPVRVLIMGTGSEMPTALREQFRKMVDSGLVIVDYGMIEDKIVGNSHDKYDITFFDEELTRELGNSIRILRRCEDEWPELATEDPMPAPKHNNGKGMRDRWGRVRGRYR